MPKKKKLRTGFSTGTAATAAAKAALTLLLEGQSLREVSVSLPGGGSLLVTVSKTELLDDSAALAAVIKDAGDDPDVTHKAEIRARVELTEANGREESVAILGGEGVGVVTKPGLDLAVGEPAINPVPRSMISRAMQEAWSAGGRSGRPRVKVTVSVPEGRRLAKRTLNPRLGIMGGISILGTTGLVKPFSHRAYTATIESGLKVAKAMGLEEIVLTTGRRSEKQAMALRPDLDETAFVQMADYFSFALEQAALHGFKAVGLVSFFGKAVKQAMALPCTHAHQAPMDLGRLSSWLEEGGAPAPVCRAVAQANTARHALEVLREAGRLDLCPLVGHKALAAMRSFAGEKPTLWCTIIDYDYSVLFQGRLEPGWEEHHA